MLIAPTRTARHLATLTLTAAALLLAGCGGTPTETGADPRAASQGFLGEVRPAGPCTNRDINAAFPKAIGRPPSGEGTIGECWPNYYGGGPPWSDQYLVQAVVNSRVCSDPWLGQALQEVNRQRAQASLGAIPMPLPAPGIDPPGRGGLCNHMLYNSGVWGSYDELVRLATVTVNALAEGQMVLHPNGAAVWNGKVYFPPVEVAILEGRTNEVALAASPQSLGLGANEVVQATVAATQGKIIAVGGGNIIAAGGGNVVRIIAAGGGN